MRKSSIIILTTIFFVGFALFNCNSSIKKVIKEDDSYFSIKKEINNSDKIIASAQKDTYSDFQKFIKDANFKIIKNVENISDMKQLLLADGNITNKTFIKEVEELEKDNNEFKTELDNYVANGSGNWKDFKNEFDTNLNEFEIAFSQVKVVWQN